MYIQGLDPGRRRLKTCCCRPGERNSPVPPAALPYWAFLLTSFTGVHSAVRRLALVGTLVAALTLTACGGGSDEPQSATCPGGKIRFGVEPFEDPAKLTPAAKVLADALGESLDCPVELTVTEDYSAEVLAMENGKLDIGIFGPLGYVFASQRAKAEALASFGDANGKLSSYTAGIWVPKNSKITSVEQLRGHSLAPAATPRRCSPW